MQNSKKILICDDYALRSESLKKGFEQRGYKVGVLTNESPTYIVKNIGSFVEQEKPDYLIIDSLEGNYLDAAKTAKEVKKDLIVILSSAKDEAIEKAKKHGYLAFKKLDEDYIMFKYVMNNQNAKT